ncbi:hypothetical protein [Silvanigrella aquatica]|uniref:Uncharacterized protein n=1 Tax=Silvanigrella aquatica TaxID=1915309 RepID=A0A1L4CYA8_9BACT|nr:hypothetical protein [Silvanigrella aquatica]APJ02941.1 hypothetical protein AXG55_03030 [Silvanigrella aquatica]
MFFHGILSRKFPFQQDLEYIKKYENIYHKTGVRESISRGGVCYIYSLFFIKFYLEEISKIKLINDNIFSAIKLKINNHEKIIPILITWRDIQNIIYDTYKYRNDAHLYKSILNARNTDFSQKDEYEYLLLDELKIKNTPYYNKNKPRYIFSQKVMTMFFEKNKINCNYMGTLVNIESNDNGIKEFLNRCAQFNNANSNMHFIFNIMYILKDGGSHAVCMIFNNKINESFTFFDPNEGAYHFKYYFAFKSFFLNNMKDYDVESFSFDMLKFRAD